MVHTIDDDIRELEILDQHREWVAGLSEKEFKQWEKHQAKFATIHFAEIEHMIDETLEYIRKHPHNPDSIKRIGIVIHSLGEMMQNFDYLGVIKMGIGHEAENEILDKIASIVQTIRNGTKLYYHHSCAQCSDE